MQPFDPFADLLAAQAARPEHLTTLDLRSLTPFQRALLSLDGTVTKFIEAYHLEPVDIVVLQQQPQILAHAHPWLELAAQCEVVARQVVLRGRYSGTRYAYAVSLLAKERLPEHVLRDVAHEPAGLGRVLLNSQLEQRRELLWYGAECLHDLPVDLAQVLGTHFLSRTYRIISGGQPVMVISEKFPVDSVE